MFVERHRFYLARPPPPPRLEDGEPFNSSGTSPMSVILLTPTPKKLTHSLLVTCGICTSIAVLVTVFRLCIRAHRGQLWYEDVSCTVVYTLALLVDWFTNGKVLLTLQIWAAFGMSALIIQMVASFIDPGIAQYLYLLTKDKVITLRSLARWRHALLSNVQCVLCLDLVCLP